MSSPSPGTLTYDQVAAMLGISADQVGQWVLTGRPPSQLHVVRRTPALPGMEGVRTHDADGQPLALTYAQVAEALAVSPQTVMEYVKSGRIPGPVYLGMSARFPASIVDEVLRHGLSAPGTFTPPPSPRAELGRIGQQALQAAKRKAKRRPGPTKPKGK